jgi:hypothetical protein
MKIVGAIEMLRHVALQRPTGHGNEMVNRWFAFGALDSVAQDHTLLLTQ